MNKTKFIVNGNYVSTASFSEDMIQDSLPVGIYRLRHSPMGGFVLTMFEERFPVPEVTFGGVTAKAERVVNHYKNSDKSTGVLLSGDKGSGKTMTSNVLCNMALDLGKPVILIEDRFTGSDFNSFIDSLGEVVLFFDEFAKTYSVEGDEFDGEHDPQDKLLSLFDGTGKSKRLIILTENKEYNVNEFLIDRPGRVRYHYRHGKLDSDTIEEVCNHRGVPEDVQKELIFASFKSQSFSFDILGAIIDEYESMGTTLKDAMDGLNVPVMSSDDSETLELVSYKVDGKDVTSQFSVCHISVTDMGFDTFPKDKDSHFYTKFFRRSDIHSLEGNLITYRKVSENEEHLVTMKLALKVATAQGSTD